MKQWLIPAIVLLAVAGAGLGVGWSVNEWQDGGEPAPVATPTAQTGPTQAELDAEQCKAALEALGQAASKPPGERRSVIPPELTEAVSRYCH